MSVHGLVLVALLQGAAAPELPGTDSRSTIWVREECSGSTSWREMTLFANGTIRLREGPRGAVKMVLREVGRAEAEAFRRRLEELDFAETEAEMTAPGSEWTERCRLELTLPDRATERFDYERYSSGSLALGAARRVVEDLLEEVRKALLTAEIPSTYRPQIGDLLESPEGEIYEIVAFTLEGKGVELVGTVQPVTIYIGRDDLRLRFRRLVDRP